MCRCGADGRDDGLLCPPGQDHHMHEFSRYSTQFKSATTHEKGTQERQNLLSTETRTWKHRCRPTFPVVYTSFCALQEEVCPDLRSSSALIPRKHKIALKRGYERFGNKKGNTGLLRGAAKTGTPTLYTCYTRLHCTSTRHVHRVQFGYKKKAWGMQSLPEDMH